MSKPISSKPGKLFSIFALALLGVAVFTVLDQGKRSNLEAATPDPALAETALSDTELFPNADRFKIGDEVVKADGKPYFRLRDKVADKRDEWIVRVVRDDSDRFWIYRETKPATSKTPPEPNRYFLKLGRRQFLQITDVPPQS